MVSTDPALGCPEMAQLGCEHSLDGQVGAPERLDQLTVGDGWRVPTPKGGVSTSGGREPWGGTRGGYLGALSRPGHRYPAPSTPWLGPHEPGSSVPISAWSAPPQESTQRAHRPRPNCQEESSDFGFRVVIKWSTFKFPAYEPTSACPVNYKENSH